MQDPDWNWNQDWDRDQDQDEGDDMGTHSQNTSRSGGAGEPSGATVCSPQQGSPLPWEGHKEESAGV